MKKARRCILTGLLCLFTVAIASGAQGRKNTDEAVRIADNVLLFQRDTGGWPKNVDMDSVLSELDKAELRNDKSKKDSTLDNGATHKQIRYLAKVYYSTRLRRFKNALLRGVDYLLEAQYANGGWPQFYPLEGHSGYYRYVTFNDGAMIGAMSVLRDIAEKKPEYAFIDKARRQKSEKAVRKGIECILKCQIIVDGRKTAWCAQHDEKTFVPRKARSYELPSISGSESVGVVRFLMSIDNPAPEIIEAVQSAVAWFDRAKITGIRQINKPDESLEGGFDKIVIKDATAPPIWARFYQIGTNRPIFCSRDGIPKATLAEISYERRTGYSWYGYGPAELLAEDYPSWQKKWVPEKNVLSK